jgi:prevent-host-death family protein
MQTFTANDAKQNLGKVMDAALQSPVSITKHGRPAVIVTSDAEYHEFLRTKYQKLKDAVSVGFDELDRGLRSEYSTDDIAERVLRRKNGNS